MERNDEQREMSKVIRIILKIAKCGCAGEGGGGGQKTPEDRDSLLVRHVRKYNSLVILMSLSSCSRLTYKTTRVPLDPHIPDGGRVLQKHIDPSRCDM